MSTLLDLFKTMEYGPAPESPAAANVWLDDHGRKFGLFINNRWHDPQSQRYLTCLNPATGAQLAEVADAGEADVEAAASAARAAFKKWSKTPGHTRARYLYGIARHLQKHQRLLSVIESMDNGKTIRETRDIDIP